MNVYAEKASEQPKTIADNTSRASLVNSRPEARNMQNLQHSASGGTQVKQLQAYQTMANQAVVQRRIKVDKEEYTMPGFQIPETLYKALLAKGFVPTSQALDILSRYDFQNRSFKDIDALIKSITDQILEEHLPLPEISTQQMLTRVVNPNDPMDVEVVLARGLHSNKQFETIVLNRTAGGESLDVNAVPPTEESALDQVKTEVVPWKVKDPSVLHKSDLAEYTTKYSIANSFGRSRGGTLVIMISAKYLREGSTSECGWVAAKSAPIKVVTYIPPGK